jgi:hypothetical protein
VSTDLNETLAGMQFNFENAYPYQIKEGLALLSAVHNVLALCDEHLAAVDPNSYEDFDAGCALVASEVRKALTDALGASE